MAANKLTWGKLARVRPTPSPFFYARNKDKAMQSDVSKYIEDKENKEQ